MSIFPFASVLVISMIFLLLTIVRQSKFSVVYATFGMVCWFALSGLSLLTFEVDGIAIAWLWVALGIVTEIIGLTLTLNLLKADKENKDFTL